MNASSSNASSELHLLTSPALWLCAVAAAFAMSSAHASHTPDELTPPADAASMTPQQAYAHDKAFCTSGHATQPRALCLKEAARAYRENRAGRLEPRGTALASGTGRAASPRRAATSGTGAVDRN